MTDSHDRGISQSAFKNPGPYIPIWTTSYGLGTLRNDDGAGRRERENGFFHVAVTVPVFTIITLRFLHRTGQGHFIKRYQSGNIKNVGQLKLPAQTLSSDSLLEDQMRYFLCRSS